MEIKQQFIDRMNKRAERFNGSFTLNEDGTVTITKDGIEIYKETPESRRDIREVFRNQIRN